MEEVKSYIRFWSVVVCFSFDFRKLRLWYSKPYSHFFFIPFTWSNFHKNVTKLQNDGDLEGEKVFQVEFTKELKMVFLTYYIIFSNLAIALLIADVFMIFNFVTAYITAPVFIISLVSWWYSKRELNGYILGDMWTSLITNIYDDRIEAKKNKNITNNNLV